MRCGGLGGLLAGTIASAGGGVNLLRGHRHHLYLKFLFDHLAACLQHPVDGVEGSGVVITLAAFLADLHLYVIHNIQLMRKPMNFGPWSSFWPRIGETGWEMVNK